MKSHTIFVISAAATTAAVTSTPASSTAPFIGPFATHGSRLPPTDDEVYVRLRRS